MKTFKNKVALITGAASGMGRYLAINLAKEGADVVICDVDESGLKETEKLIKAYNVGSSSLLLDVRDKKEVEELPTKIIENHERSSKITRAALPVSLKYSPIAAPVKGAKNCIGAGADEGAETTVV